MTLLRIILLAALAALHSVAHAEERKPTELETALTAVVERLTAKTQDPLDPELVASVVAEASQGNERRAIQLLVQLYGESRGSARIQEGRCAAFECDPGRTASKRVHRARGAFQVQDDRDGELWENALGLARENLLAGATLADKRLRMCRDITESYSAQDGKGCRVTMHGRARYELHKRVAGMLAREMAKGRVS